METRWQKDLAFEKCFDKICQNISRIKIDFFFLTSGTLSACQGTHLGLQMLTFTFYKGQYSLRASDVHSSTVFLRFATLAHI